MRGKRCVLALVVAALAMLPAGRAAILGPTRAQDHQTLFQDSVGDAPASADIATVVVSNDNAGFLSFQVVFTGKPAKDLTVRAYLDTDRNAATGAPNLTGADYEVVVWDLSEGGGTFSLRRWSGKTFQEFYSQPPDAALKGGVLTFAFDKSDLGKMSDFNFALTTERHPAVTLDRAPNAGRTPWSFHIKTAPVRLSILGLKTTPKPREGHTLVASMALKPSSPIAGLASRIDGPACTAIVAAKLLRERSSSMNETAGSPIVTAVCRWRIPPGTGGKLFRGSVHVTFRGKTLTRSFSVKITPSSANAPVPDTKPMALALSDLPAGFAVTEAHYVDNKRASRESSVPLSTYVTWGRVTGYEASFNNGKGPEKFMEIASGINSYRTPHGARLSMLDSIRRNASKPAVTRLSTAPSIGQETYFFKATFKVKKRTFVAYDLVWRENRVNALTEVVGGIGRADQTLAIQLARKQEARILKAPRH